MKQKRWLALLLTLVMAFSVICPVSVLAADTGYGDEITTDVIGGTYTDTTADAGTAYTYTIVGSDGSEATAEVMAAGDATETLTTTPTISWQRTADTNNNYVPNIAYVNSGRSFESGGVTYDRYTALTWNWSALNKLINDQDTKVEDVWITQTDNMSACKFSQDGNGGSSWDKASVYKISGTFAWPEGYDLNETTITIQSANDSSYSEIYEYINSNLSDLFPNGKVLPVNDDVYVVMWVDDGSTTVTYENINDYLLFWTGTSGKGFWTQRGNTNADWNRQTPATFISAGKQGVRAFHDAWPNAVGVTAGLANTDVVNNEFSYLDHTDGWYTLTDTSAINSVMRNNYDSIAAGATVHLDLYCFNNDGEGIIDELVVNLATQRETETTVTVNYYYGNVTTPVDAAHFLGSSVLTNQAYGTSISLPAGTNASQLDYMRAAAIIKAGNQDVSNGHQVNNPLVVTRDADNVINVLYTAKDAKVIYLTAPSDTVAYDGESHTLNTVAVTESGYDTAATALSDGKYTLPDGNTLENVYSVVTATEPGKYPNNFTTTDGSTTTYAVRDSYNNDVTGTYTFIKTPGTLTITYAPAAANYTYDFGVTNTYSDVLNPVELKAEADIQGTPPKGVSYTSNAITYTPQRINEKVTVDLTLTFTGNYQVTKNITIVPATNVLYEEDFFIQNGMSTVKWSTDGTANSRTVTDNGTTVYGYSAAYGTDLGFSNGSALKATVTENCQGLNYEANCPSATFTFTGTGFDIYSECGADTGMLFVTVRDAITENAVAGYMVDTLFNGTFYTEGDNGTVTVDGGRVYQIPVVHNADLTYGTYKVTVYGYYVNRNVDATPMSVSGADDAVTAESLAKELGLDDVGLQFVYMDKSSPLATLAAGGAIRRDSDDGAVTFAVGSDQIVYLDGFRVYNPLNGHDAYTAANEANPTYVSLFKVLMDQSEQNQNVLVFVEKSGETYKLNNDYQIKSGPQNEIYLKPGQSVAFTVANSSRVMVSAKTIYGMTTMNNVGITSDTEQYFELTDTNGTYTITNNGNNILSLVNLKLIGGELTTADADTFAAIATALDATVTLQDGTVVEPIKPVVPERPVDSEWVNPFVDVHEKDWFYNDVKYTVQNGLFYGMSATEFGPELVMNRAMLVTVLYRIAGEPEVTGEMPFSDVSTGKWYSDAILWAAQNDIVAGIGGGKFAPTATVTREQMATILYRYWKLSNPDADAAGEISESFTDRGSISGWALEAMQWAVENGLIYGVTNTLLDPKGGAPRAQTAAIIARYDRLVSGK